MSNCVDIDLDKSLIVQIYDLQQENARLKEIENKLNFIKNRKKSRCFTRKY